VADSSRGDRTATEGAKDDLRLPGILTRAILVAAVLGAVFFEAAYFLGWFADDSALRGTLFNSLYAFDLSVILASSGSLFLAFWKTKRPAFLLSSVALFSWFLGAFFFVSYVFLLKRILIYPSVAEFAFQGFHLLMIVVLYEDLLRHGRALVKPVAAVIPVITLMPVASLLHNEIPLNNLLYSTFFMFLISVTVFLVVNLLVQRRLLLVCAGLAAVVFADMAFVETSLVKSGFVFSLDPVWFTGFALTAFGIVFAVRRGEMG
jgi:hypothetical protein